jgi:hypothetical protein
MSKGDQDWECTVSVTRKGLVYEVLCSFLFADSFRLAAAHVYDVYIVGQA